MSCIWEVEALKKLRIIFMIACLSICFTGCSETKEFDAKGYVKSYLDAAYKNDYEAYAEFEGETTEELRDKWDEQTYEEVASYLMERYPEEEIGSVTKLLDYRTEARKLAKYKVMKATKTEDGFQVKIQAEASNVFELWEECSDVEKMKKKAENDSIDFGDALAEALEIAIDENEYEKPREIVVEVKQDGEDAYIEMNQKEMLERALFPKKSPRTVIKAMLTCPNEELFSQEAVVIMGEGTEGVQDADKVKKEQEKIASNWNKKVGDMFATGALDKFIGESGSFYLAQAQMEEKEISVKEIKREEKSDTTETYAVTILKGDSEEIVKLEFTYNEDDLIESVSFK